MASIDTLNINSIEDAIAAGEDALENSRFEEATNHFKYALRLIPRSANEEALIRCRLSEALEKRGLWPEQLEPVSKYSSPGDFERLAEKTQMEVLIRLGWGHSMNRDIPRAIAHFNRAFEIAHRHNDHDGMGKCHFGLGRAYGNFSEHRIAHDHYLSALDHFRQTGNWRNIAESYLKVGYAYAYDGDYRNGRHYLRQALTFVGDHEDHDILGRTHMYLALTYDNLGLTESALDSWERAQKHFEAAGNVTFLAINQNNLADKLIWLGEWDRAEQLLHESIEILKSASPINHGGVIDTLAQLQLLRGNIEYADKLSDEAIELLTSVKAGEWVELTARITAGRSYLLKGQPDEAMKSIERTIEISERTGDQRYVHEAPLWMAEALLQKGRIAEARQLVDGVWSKLRRLPVMQVWGLMMRMAAKVEAAEGHIAAATQSLSQSTSIYELRGYRYECAVNSMVLAKMLRNQGSIPEAIGETELAVAVFKRLGAMLDYTKATEFLEELKTSASDDGKQSREGDQFFSAGQGSRATFLDLASAMDGYIAQRLVQASVTRELLLYEITSISRTLAAGQGAIVFERPQADDLGKNENSFIVAASVGLGENEQKEDLEFISKLPLSEYDRNLVYTFSDNQQSDFLLHIISPRSERFLTGTVNLEPLLGLVEQGLESHYLKSRVRRTQAFNPARLLSQVELPGFICASRAMSRVLEQIHKIRSSDVTVLITGESGTGKELIARAVHAGSSRRVNIFLPFNCSAAPREMVESQLFGYRKGAFTGAIASNPGIIRAAERGTLFLDEIGDLPLDLQPKLLRFLQEGEIHPIGENKPEHVDVRVVAATNSALEKAVEDGKFREDLFHRLNVIRIEVPPLRERREEIPALVNHYMTQYQEEASKREIQLTEEAVDLLVVYDWPGNVRQLCNEVRRIIAYSDSGTLVSPEALSPQIVRAVPTSTPSTQKAAPTSIQTPSGVTLAEAVEELEKQMIQDAMRRNAGNIARAAKELGLSRKGLYLKMDRFKFKL